MISLHLSIKRIAVDAKLIKESACTFQGDGGIMFNLMDNQI